MRTVAMLNTWGHVYWPIFLIISAAWVLLGFGVPEFMSLAEGAHNPNIHVDNTLSYYARYELNVSAGATIHGAAWWFTFVVWMMFVIFITGHIWFDQFG